MTSEPTVGTAPPRDRPYAPIDSLRKRGRKLADDLVPGTPGFSERARRAGLGVAMIVIPLPLQWFDFGKGTLGTLRFFHLGAILCLFIARPTASMYRAAMRQVQPLFGASAILILVGTATSIGWNSNVLQFPQGGFYILCCILSAGCLIVAFQDEAGLRVVAWSAPIAVVVFLVALVYSVRGAGINVASQFAQAFAGDPHALQFGLFRAAFRTVEPNVRASVRHSVFGGVMIVLYVGVAASALSNYLRKTQILCLVICVPLVIFSLSRSVELGVALTALVAILRVVLSGRMRIAVFLLGFSVLGSLPFLIPKLIPLFSAKLTSTSSYDARLGAIDSASQTFVNNLIVGGPSLDHPTQLLIIDTLQRAGLVAGIASVVINVVIIATLIRLVALYWRTGEIVLLAAIGADIHILIRTFTGGGNLMSMVEWLGFALVIAVSYLMTQRGDMVAGGFAFRLRRKSLMTVPETKPDPSALNGHHDPSALNGHATVPLDKRDIPKVNGKTRIPFRPTMPTTTRAIVRPGGGSHRSGDNGR